MIMSPSEIRAPSITCRTCHGLGYVWRWLFFKRICSDCGGACRHYRGSVVIVNDGKAAADEQSIEVEPCEMCNATGKVSAFWSKKTNPCPRCFGAGTITKRCCSMKPYQPPAMRWNRVEIIAPEGFEFGIAHDSDDGTLSIAVRPPGDEWPSGLILTGINKIAPGHRCYIVRNDEGNFAS